ncbi:MAG TPA: hypothetical protein ENJ80_04315 [Gammaproteobacteria bacterium]|nr:hypothetical protein [Gammaproteobacteria bacterium]
MAERKYKDHGRNSKIVDGHFVRNSNLLPFGGKNLDEFDDDEDKARAIETERKRQSNGGTAYRRPSLTTGLTLDNLPEYQSAISQHVLDDPIAYSAILGVLRSTSNPAKLPVSSMGTLMIYATAVADHERITDEINETRPERYYTSNAGIEIEKPIYKVQRELGKQVDTLAKSLKLHDLSRAVQVRSRAKPKGEPIS